MIRSSVLVAMMALTSTSGAMTAEELRNALTDGRKVEYLHAYGFVQGIVEYRLMMDRDSGTKTFCPPDNVTVGDSAEAVRQLLYLIDGAALKVQGAAAVIVGIEQKWPCPVVKKQRRG